MASRTTSLTRISLPIIELMLGITMEAVRSHISAPQRLPLNKNGLRVFWAPFEIIFTFIPFRVQYPAACGERRGSGLAPRLIPFIVAPPPSTGRETPLGPQNGDSGLGLRLQHLLPDIRLQISQSLARLQRFKLSLPDCQLVSQFLDAA